jgi:Zn-dependent protease
VESEFALNGGAELNFQGIKRDESGLEWDPPMAWLNVDYEEESVVFRLPDGTPVSTHYSFALIALLVMAPLLFHGRLVVAGLMVVILYLSILAHELGHKAAAARQQARTTEIEISFYGGSASLEWDYDRKIAMRPVALAGPMVNLALAGAAYAFYWLLREYGGTADLAWLQKTLSRTLFLAFLLNLWLGLFNLLPAYPLDGGTIAEELLATRLGVRRARLTVGICGIVIAALGAVVIFVSVLAGVPFLILASLAANREAIRNNWIGWARPTHSQRPQQQVASVIQFRKRGERL